MKLILMGDDNAGKTSIAEMLFNQYPDKKGPSIQKRDVYNFKIHEIDYTLFDIPKKKVFGDIDSKQQHILQQSQALIYVINPQRGLQESLEDFLDVYQGIYKLFLGHYFIFINKIDVDFALDNNREIMLENYKKILFDREDINPGNFSFDFTSIKDYSVYRAFSLVIQKTLPTTMHINSMLITVAKYSKLEAVLVYDIITKLVIGYNDKTPVTQNIYGICSDLIDLYASFLVNIQVQQDQMIENQEKIMVLEASIKEKLETMDSQIPNEIDFQDQQKRNKIEKIEQEIIEKVMAEQVTNKNLEIKDKIQIKMHMKNQQNKEQIQIIRLQQIHNSSLVICFVVKDFNFQPICISRNIDLACNGVMKFMDKLCTSLNQQ